MLAFWALFLFLSLATYHPEDPSLNHVVSSVSEVHNGAGLVGAYFSGLLVDFFGLGAFACPVAFCLGALQCGLRRPHMRWWRWTGFAVLSICFSVWSASVWVQDHIAFGAVSGGGFFGQLLLSWSQYYLRSTGTFLLWLFFVLLFRAIAFRPILG